MDVKGLRDALLVRNHVIDCFEEAEHLDDQAPTTSLPSSSSAGVQPESRPRQTRTI